MLITTSYPSNSQTKLQKLNYYLALEIKIFLASLMAPTQKKLFNK